MMPERSTPLSTAASDAAGAVDRVDRPHVVAVTFLDGRAGVEIDAERRAEQRVLDVVDGERVAGEHRVRRSRCGRSRRSRRCRRCGRPPGPSTKTMRPPVALDVAHHRGDLGDAHLDPALGRDLVGHEREAVPVALAELGDDRGCRRCRRRSDRRAARRAACGTSALPSRRRSPRPCAGARPRSSVRRGGRRCGGWSSNRSPRARSRPCPPCAHASRRCSALGWQPRATSSSSSASSVAWSGAVTFRRRRE